MTTLPGKNLLCGGGVSCARRRMRKGIGSLHRGESESSGRLGAQIASTATVWRVLHDLLRAKVSIRGAGCILESPGEAANITKNPIVLTQFAGQSTADGLQALFECQRRSAGVLFRSHNGTWNGIRGETRQECAAFESSAAESRRGARQTEQGARRPGRSRFVLTGWGWRYFLPHGESPLPNLVALA